MLLRADKIHDGRRWLPANSMLEVADDGTIIAIHEHHSSENIQYFEGILCPGFINAHCHTELSHMKGFIPEHTGLVGFLLQVMQQRNGFTDQDKEEARQAAVQQMIVEGIVAVGDIANTTDTLSLRESAGLHWFTFVESIGFTPERAAVSFDFALKTYEVFAAQKNDNKILKQAIVPHAPYSVSDKLFQLIAAHGAGATLSVHNQETADEDLYYLDKSGAFSNFLQTLGIDDTSFLPSGKSSLQTYREWLSSERTLMLVHNTFSSEADIHYIQGKGSTTFWCLCPNANLYIENRLPDIPMLLAHGVQLCIGTDSLASNHQLSVLSELQAIQHAFPQIGWEQLLCWATYNGACALQMETELGSFEAGKKPGVLQLNNEFSVHRVI